MEFVLIGHYFAKVGYVFDLSTNTKRLLMDKVNQNILSMVDLPFKTLEIWLDTNANEPTCRITAPQKVTKRTKTLRYTVQLPYPLIVKEGKVDIDVFIDEFLDALSEILNALSPLFSGIEQTKKELKEEINNQYEHYAYQASNDEKWVKKFLQEQDSRVLNQAGL